jgi:DivIVA domain-containing protein
LPLDRQSIEKRDFPIARRGYDPAAVDAHLRALAVEVDELRRTLSEGRGESLAATAGSQVASILQAAETTAAEIERQASTEAHAVREQANAEALHTREQAIGQARAHVQSVSQATAKLLGRVQSMDGEMSSLVDRVRSSADRLSGELASVESNVGALYDTAARQTPPPPPPLASVEPEPSLEFIDERPEMEEPAEQVTDSGDLDGARLVALNMALNGESREDTDSFLMQNFQLSDRQQLLDEVYAAIEG